MQLKPDVEAVFDFGIIVELLLYKNCFCQQTLFCWQFRYKII